MRCTGLARLASCPRKAAEDVRACVGGCRTQLRCCTLRTGRVSAATRTAASAAQPKAAWRSLLGSCGNFLSADLGDVGCPACCFFRRQLLLPGAGTLSPVSPRRFLKGFCPILLLLCSVQGRWPGVPRPAPLLLPFPLARQRKCRGLLHWLSTKSLDLKLYVRRLGAV